jgi:hypothetical protein
MKRWRAKQIRALHGEGDEASAASSAVVYVPRTVAVVLVGLDLEVERSVHYLHSDRVMLVCL